MMTSAQAAYFTKRPALPVLQAYALQSILEPHLVLPAGCALTNSPSENRIRQVQALVEQAETEMVATCIGYDLGMHMLDSAPEIVDDAFAACYATGFPFGTTAVQLLQGIAYACDDLPSHAWAAPNVHAQCAAILQHNAEGFTLYREGVALPSTLWQAEDWHAYFAHFPNEEFRIPVLAAVRNLRNRTPHAFNERARNLFRYFFPEKNDRFDHVTWRDEISIGKLDETDNNDDPDSGGHAVAR